MMSSLHKLFDHGVHVAGSYMDRSSGLFLVIKRMTDGVRCFDVGDAGELAGVSIDGSNIDDIKLPYLRCWFEFHTGVDVGAPKRYAVLTERLPLGSRFYFLVWAPEYGRYFLYADLDEISADAINLRTCLDEEGPPDREASLQLTSFAMCSLGIVVRFLKMLACVNVDCIELPVDSALVKSRLKKGKVPMFSSWVCVLKGKVARGDWVGGTHSSPRLHYRRGHVRKWPTGDIWVRECMVGSKELGLVEKTYSRKKGAPPSAQVGS